MSEKIALSVVIPVYGSETIFPELYRRLVDTLTGLAEPFEIITVVDNSPDDVAKVIRGFRQDDTRIRLFELSRNFGHQVAVTAGLEQALGEMVVIMDDDLEDPPEVIPELIRKANEGFDVVYGIRRRRSTTIFRRLSYYIFYRLLRSMTNIDIPLDSGDFCLMRRTVVDVLNQMPERNRYLRGMRAWAGYRQTGLAYDRGSRYAGDSGYTFSKYFRFALDGILSFSYRPLEYVSVVGLFMATASFLLGMRFLLWKALGRIPDVPGWTSLMVITLFLGGVQLISVGIIGQYIARIYDEVKQRPAYIIKPQNSPTGERPGENEKEEA